MATRREGGAKVKKKGIGTTPRRILRIVFLVAGFVLLGTIFLMIVVPRDRGAVTPPAGDISPEEKATEEVKDKVKEEAPEVDEDYAGPEDDEESTDLEEGDTEAGLDDEGEEAAVDYAGVYIGAGDSETADTRTGWDISMELSGDSFVSIDCKVNHIEDVVSGAGSGAEFRITANSIDLNISTTGKDDIVITSEFDGKTAEIFTINEQRQFFLFVTPRKVNVNTALLPKELLTAGGNTPLIDMSGFVKEDGIVVGMLRLPLVPMVEFRLELVGD